MSVFGARGARVRRAAAFFAGAADFAAGRFRMAFGRGAGGKAAGGALSAAVQRKAQ